MSREEGERWTEEEKWSSPKFPEGAVRKSNEISIAEPVARPNWLDKFKGRASTADLTPEDLEGAKLAMQSDPAIEKNGWTVEGLAKYFKERELAGPDGSRPSIKPRRTNGWHNPHRWRR